MKSWIVGGLLLVGVIVVVQAVRQRSQRCYTIEFATPSGAPHPIGSGPSGCYATPEEAEAAAQDYVSEQIARRLRGSLR